MLHKKRKPSTFTSSSGINCKYDAARKDMLHSKSTYFYRWLPISCSLALLLGLGIIVNPTAGKTETVYAAGESDECKTTADDNGVCAMELGIFMNGTDSAFSELPATELSTDSVVHRDYSFSIRAVDTKDGYDLYAGVVNTGSFGNSLVNADYPTKEYMIKALSGENIAYSSIGNNKWGYALTTEDTYTTPAEELTYNSLPTTTITTENNQTILTSGKLIAHGEDTGYDPSQPIGEDKHTDQDYKLYFAAKASPESPSGHYRTQVMLSLVANPKLAVNTMQKFAEIGTCTTLPDKTSIQLVDARDRKKYWITKSNGTCIMTQNLDLDLNTDQTLASDLSDVSEKWTPTSSTMTGADWTWNTSNYRIVQSYDPGEYLVNQATSSWVACSTIKDPANCNRYTAITNSTDPSDLHYAVGNYYSWGAAIANSSSTNEVIATNSICPAGWKLFDNAGDKSFYNLLTGITSDSVRNLPYSFPAAGRITGSIVNVGAQGWYWSSTYNGSSTRVRALYFNSQTLNSQYDDAHSERNDGYYGHSVRCILK